ncbi:MAG: hypothetical protein ACREDL_03010 [Bradyrhizobium sp.]
MRGRPTKDPYTRPAINTLERLHAELGGKILENKQQHADLAEQMRQVESVIKMLDPSYSLRAISVKRRKGNEWFKRGTLYRKALDVLRTATEAMTATEIATAVLKTEGVEDTSSKQLTILGQSIKASLRNHAGKGVMQCNEGIPAKWRLAEVN